MSTESPPSRTSHGSLADFVSSLETSENPDQELIERVIETARRTDPDLAEALRFCAIPRRFDAEIIGVLRDAPADMEGNRRILAGLQEHNFVLPRRDGGFVYHDTVRDLLLKDWRGDARRESFKTFNRRLIGFYEAQHQRAQALEESFARVAAVIERGSDARYLQVAGAVEERAVVPLLEGLYHAISCSGEEGDTFFMRYYHSYESAGRLTLCRSLLNAAAEFFDRLLFDEERERWLRWARYYQARLAHSLLDGARAEEILRALLPNTAEDVRLRLWIFSELGAVLQEKENLKEARETYKQQLELAEKTRADPFNLPLLYIRLAGIEWGVGELQRAADQYRKGIESAGEENNPRVAVETWFQLSGVLQECGAQEEAIAAALDGFRLARGSFARDSALQRALGQRFIGLSARNDPQVLETVFAEALELSKSAEPFIALSIRNQYAAALREGGQVRRAGTAAMQIRNDARGYEMQDFGTDILFRETLMLEDQGRLEEAIHSYTEIIQRARSGRGTAWHLAAALSNRGSKRSERALFPEAETDLRAAIEQWESLDYQKLAAFVRVLLSIMLRRVGRVDEAQREIDLAQGPLQNGSQSFLADYHRAQGELFRLRGLWEEAAGHVQQALKAALSIDDRRNAADDYWHLSLIAATQGHWTDATQASNGAARVWQQLAEVDTYEPSPSENKANLENARGLRQFCASMGERRENVLAARDLFTAASEGVPGNAWYQLNLAMASMELRDWVDAATVLEKLLAEGPAWLRSPVLGEWLTECHIRHGNELATKGDGKAAGAAYAVAEAQLDAADRPDALRQHRLADYWREIGDGLFEIGHSTAAEVRYQRSYDRARAANSIVAARAAARLGFIAAHQGNLPRAVEHFAKSLELRGDDPAASSGLMTDAVALVNSSDDYVAIAEAFRWLARDPSLDRNRRGSLLSNCRELALRRRKLLRSGLDGAKDYPNFSPLALRIDARFFSAGDDTVEKRLITVELPALRQRIQQSSGVVVPGIMVHAESSYGPGVYVVLANEVPIASATAPVEGNNTHAAALETIVAHLETILRGRLGTFIGIQEAHELLKQWSGEDEGRRALWRAVLPDSAAQARFVRLLQGLVNEGVPVTDLGSVLVVLRDAQRGTEMTDLVEKARAGLGYRAPEGLTFIRVSAEIEAKIREEICERNGKKFLVMTAEKTSKLLDAIKALGEVDAPDAALVVSETAVRPFVRLLVAATFPKLRVFAARELVEPIAPGPTGK